MPVLYASADLVDDVLQVYAHGEFEHAAALYITADREEFGAGAVLRAELPEPFCAVINDGGDVCQRFHVVQHGGLPEESLDAGERRAEARLAAFSLDGFKERCLFAAHIGAGAGTELDLEVVAASHHILSEISKPLRVLTGCLHDGENIGVLCPEVNVSHVGAHGLSADRHAFKDRTGVGGEEDTVLVGARLALIGVADDVAHRILGGTRELHFPPGGEPRTAAAPETGGFYDFDDFRGLHGQGFFQSFKAAARCVFCGAFRVDLSPVPEEIPDFPDFFFHHFRHDLHLLPDILLNDVPGTLGSQV